MNRAHSTKIRSFSYAIGAVALAGLLGLGSGAAMARIAPLNKFSWAGLAVAPLWFSLEFFFEGVVAILGEYAKTVRVASTIAVVAGFYVAWFLLRW
jgi:hypothetical protein